MSFPRATFFFTDGRFAWTETYFSLLTSDDLADHMLRAIRLGRNRVGCLAGISPSKGAELSEIRVSLDETFRDALIDTSLRRVVGNYGYYTKGLNTGGPDPDVAVSRPTLPKQALNVRLGSNADGHVYRGRIFFSGTPQSIWSDPSGPQLFVDTDFLTAFKAFKKNLLGQDPFGGQGWGLKVKDRGATNVPRPVSGVTFALDGTATVTVEAHGFPAVDQFGGVPRVLIRGTKYLPKSRGVNGEFRYNVLDANTLKLYPGPKGRFLTPPFPVYHGAGGLAVPTVYKLVPIDQVDVVGESTRKRGASSLAPRGRSNRR